jgi:hypothetical protein
MVTDKERLIADLIDIYDGNKVDYDAVKLRGSIDQAADGLFGKLEEFVGYPRVYFTANNADFNDRLDLPATVVVKGDRVTLTNLFGIGKDEVSWSVRPTDFVDHEELAAVHAIALGAGDVQEEPGALAAANEHGLRRHDPVSARRKDHILHLVHPLVRAVPAATRSPDQRPDGFSFSLRVHQALRRSSRRVRRRRAPQLDSGHTADH